MKVVYIAHKYSDNPFGNIQRIATIVAHAFKEAIPNKLFPCAPYLDACTHLKDADPAHRAYGMEFNRHFIFSMVDELWICSRLSEGIKQEILWAEEIEIPVIDKEKYYEELFPICNYGPVPWDQSLKRSGRAG